MGWQTKADSFGGFHIVYAQENSESCGIACLAMTVFKVNKFHPGPGTVRQEKEIYKVYSHVTGAKYDGTKTSKVSFLAVVLNKLNCGSWMAECAPNVSQTIIDSIGIDYQGLGMAGDVVNTVKRGSPVIVVVNWNRGGGHAVVIDTVYSIAGQLYAAVCDPWDGNVHLTPFAADKPFNYTGKQEIFNLGIGGAHHEYTPADSDDGIAQGWVIRRV